MMIDILTLAEWKMLVWWCWSGAAAAVNNVGLNINSVNASGDDENLEVTDSNCSFPTENSNMDNKNDEVAATSDDKAQVDNSSWNCEICDFRCKKETSLNAHMSRKHPVIEQLDGNSSLISLQDRTLKCDFCDFMCEDESNLSSHLKQHEEIETAQQQLRQLEDQTNHKSQQHLRQFNNSSKGAEDQDELKRKLSLD